MRIAIHRPDFLLGDQARNYCGWNYQFVRFFRPALYAESTWMLARYFRALRRNGLPAHRFRYIRTAAGLRRAADVLVSFNGEAYLDHYAPPKNFPGMKVFHVMDYVFRSTEANARLTAAGVDYLLGYAAHDRHCPFFQKFFPTYSGRVIGTPFGFGARFVNRTPFKDRVNKVIGLGAVNPVDDPLATGDMLREYVDFYRGVTWTHQWRRMLVEHKLELAEELDSRYPEFPETKDRSADSAALLNQYTMYANDEGLMAFPPARTYEGAASGAALVCSDHPCFDDLGFKDAVNCVRHRKHDLDDFRQKVRYYQAHPDELAAIAQSGADLMRDRYRHEQLAMRLYLEIEARYRGCSS